MKAKVFLLMLLAASTLSAQNKLTIVVEGIEETTGHVLVGLYDKAGFMKKAVNGQMVKAESDTITVVLENIPAGEYAVSLFHDENDNGKLDTGSFGIPVEKYGFSNNAKGKYGPPAFEDCKFTVKEDLEITIRI
ncbi:MAG: DUF2141 domain-containing protein [Dysgonamonadaceae bacterium]|jgi:uncharacterized protein (DUF2141 family)|nr:DUF2141 domain-containing protein [Dysgonamonadaceae bacterium]